MHSEAAASTAPIADTEASAVLRDIANRHLGKSDSCAGFSVGEVVVLKGLKKGELNEHVGKIVSELGHSGRHGVRLHCRPYAESVSEAHDYPPIAVKPEHLQRIPCITSGEQVGLVGTVGPKTVSMLFGERGWGLPDTVVPDVLRFLLVERVSMDQVTVSGCSSSRGDFPLAAVLNDAQGEWWISESGTMPGGHGCEYLEFQFAPSSVDPKLRRIEFIGLKIPPMPYGPLSVRSFRVLALTASGQWMPASNELQTLDRSDLQFFALAPVDATAMRLECTVNAAAGSRASFSDCIGLFQVSFA